MVNFGRAIKGFAKSAGRSISKAAKQGASKARDIASTAGRKIKESGVIDKIKSEGKNAAKSIGRTALSAGKNAITSGKGIKGAYESAKSAGKGAFSDHYSNAKKHIENMARSHFSQSKLGNSDVSA